MHLEREAYTLAIICALPKECAAVALMFDEVHQTPETPYWDDNSYLAGSIHGKNVVVALLPIGIVDVAIAAQVASLIKPSFPNIEYGLLVGIAGALRHSKVDIRLGDVVIGAPDSHNLSAVIQHDRGRQEREFRPASNLPNPPKILLATVSKIEAERATATKEMEEIVSKFAGREGYGRPPTSEDALARNMETYARDDEETHGHSLRNTHSPRLHFGVVATGNIVMKNRDVRDELGYTTGAICIETEAAGVLAALPCLVIRGICDYSDESKNKSWQNYAALTAAAVARMTIGYMPRIEKKEQIQASIEAETSSNEKGKTLGRPDHNAMLPSMTFQNTGSGAKIAQGVFNNGTFTF